MSALMDRIKRRRWFGTAGFAAVGKRVFPRADVAVQRATRGRWSLSGTVGMPLLLLTTTGRRTGQPRVTPLTFAEDGEGLLVIGSNWGQAGHPAWALNLLASPRALVQREGVTVPVEARLLRGRERAEAWDRLLRVWPHYPAYQARAAHRELHVFRLEPPRGRESDI